MQHDTLQDYINADLFRQKIEALIKDLDQASKNCHQQTSHRDIFKSCTDQLEQGKATLEAIENPFEQ